MARRRPRKQGNWRPARDGKRMIQYHDDGTYWRHVSMAEYRRAQAGLPDLKRLLRDGMPLLKAVRFLTLPDSASMLDLIEYMLQDE